MTSFGNNKITTRTKVACGVIIRESDGEKEVLLLRRSPDDHWPLHYDLPRGNCDKPLGEKLLHCLHREVKEEAGLDIIPVGYIDKFTYIADEGTRHTTQYNFLCRMKDPNQQVRLSEEHSEHVWVSSVGEIELFLNPEMKKTVVKVLNPNEKIVDYPENEMSEETIEEYLKKIQ